MFLFSLWLVLFFVLLLIEIGTVNLVSIWFAFGALMASIVSLWSDNVTLQIIVFVVVSALVLVIMKPLVKKVRKGKIEPTNLDRVIGKIGVVTEDILPLEVGEVRIDGKNWSAVSEEPISIGQKVKILSIDGVKLNVVKIKEEL